MLVCKRDIFQQQDPSPSARIRNRQKGTDKKGTFYGSFPFCAFGTSGQFLRQSFRRQTTTGRNNRLWEEEEIRFQSIIAPLKIARKSCVSVLPNPFLEELWGSESNSLEFDTLRRRVRLEKERSLEGIDREPGGMEEII